ncbi:MAG: glycosyltransferase family 4 protein [Pseudogulbenkiania sp.]|nr:glycosyltransferase family 4 protein [Pseudogulbenkiania sp.]
MKLAYLDPHPVPDTTPSTMQMLQTVDGLGQAGVDVTLITPQSVLSPEAVLGRPLSEKVELAHQFDPRKKWFFPFSTHKPFFWQAKRALQQGRFDAVLVRNLKLADYLLRQNLGVRIYFETHEIFAQTFLEEHPELPGSKRRKHRVLKAREQFVYNHAAGVFALTSLLIDDIKQHYGIAHDRFCVLPDGFDPALAQAALQRHAGRQRPPGPLRVLYLGSLHPWKGVGTLIDALPLVQSELELVIAGGETHRIEELRARASILGVEKRVNFLGKVPPTERFDVIAQADICALPLTKSSIASRYTSPLKLFEYMAMGKPIVIADLPSIKEVVADQVSAVLFEAENKESLAAVFDKLAMLEQPRQELGKNAAKLSLGYMWASRAEIIKKKVAELR